MNFFGQRLKELRTEKKISQKQIATEINFSQSVLCDWENGKAEPTINAVIAVADYFKISIDDLVGRENFATGNIEIVGEKINDKEKQLLLAFRNLDQDGQTAFLDIADNLSKIYKQNKTVS